jgi:hypothetical protein
MTPQKLFKVIAPFGTYQRWAISEQDMAENYKRDYPNAAKPFIYVEESAPKFLGYEDLKVLYLNAATWKLIKAVDKMIGEHMENDNV